MLKFAKTGVCECPHVPWGVLETAGPAHEHDPPHTTRSQPEVPRAHHGPVNALFNPKFCAGVPRDAGARLNAPMGGTFFSTAALLAHTKISWLFHSQDQRGPSPSIPLALLQERGTEDGRNDL